MEETSLGYRDWGVRRRDGETGQQWAPERRAQAPLLSQNPCKEEKWEGNLQT